MTQAVQPSGGYESMLAAWTDGLVAFAHLYTNDPELTLARVTADFVEPIYEHYEPLPVERWTPPAMREGRAFSVCDPIIFTFTTGPPPVPLRGYYVTSGRDGPLLWAWRKSGAAYEMSGPSPTVIVYITARWPFAVG